MQHDWQNCKCQGRHDIPLAARGRELVEVPMSGGTVTDAPERIDWSKVSKWRDASPAPAQNAVGDGETAIIECLAAGKPFVFDPATNFLHADDRTVEGGILYVPADNAATAGQGVEVKPLEWIDHPGAFPSPLWSAKTLFGFYSIEEISSSDSPAYEVRGNSHRLVAVKDGLPEAKDAAQNDYEQRIRSALATPTPKEESK